ncbi:XRE family transcriptional regulator, partial [Candidatus Parcubacteria bacterium]
MAIVSIRFIIFDKQRNLKVPELVEKLDPEEAMRGRDLPAFGRKLRQLRKTCGFTQERLADELTRMLVEVSLEAQEGGNEQNRVISISGSLVSKWERGYVHKKSGKTWSPRREVVLCMLRLFGERMTFKEAARWTAQAGYSLEQSEVADIPFARPLHLESALERLPPFGEERLFGVENLQQALSHHLSQPDGGWIIALEGIGGIGKTTLACIATRQALQEEVFCHLAWVSARQEEFLPFFGLRKLDRPALSKE